MLLRLAPGQKAGPRRGPPAGCAPAPRAPGVCGVQARSCLPWLSGGSCLFPFPICLAPLGAAHFGGAIWGSLCPWGAPRAGGGCGGVCREVPGEGGGFIWQMGRRLLGHQRFCLQGLARGWGSRGLRSPSAHGMRAVLLGRLLRGVLRRAKPSLWPEEFLDLGLIAKIIAGQVNAVVSCSSLTAPVCFPLFGARLAPTCLSQPPWMRLCRANASA